MRPIQAFTCARDPQPVAQPVTGQIAFATPDGPPKSVPVQYDPKTGVLTAAGPKLEADITPVSYTLMVDGTPRSGTIDVPKGGTQDLVATGKLQASIPPSTVGPNGGVVQVVGPDRVELVTNKHTGGAAARCGAGATAARSAAGPRVEDEHNDSAGRGAV